MESPSITKENHWGQAYVSSIPAWKPREDIVRSCEVEAWIFIGDPKMLGMLEPWDPCREKLLMEWSQPKREKCVAVKKLKGVEI